MLPAYWSTGVGWALMAAALDRARAEGYASISLWVLRDNPRARRFYERAGFAATGDSELLTAFGGVTEIKYQQPLR